MKRMIKMKKSNNNDFNINNIGNEVELYGWASKVRNLGGLIFIDLRDRSGIIQLNISPECSCYEIAEKIKLVLEDIKVNIS